MLEILALALSFYFKKSKIFFIVLALLCSRSLYLFSSLYQAHVFNFLFLPFVFMLFCVLRSTELIFEKQNLNKLAVLLFVGVLALFLSKNTNFNAALGEKLFSVDLFFTPLSDFSFIFFLILFVFLAFFTFFKKEIYLLSAFFLAFLQFLFETSSKSYFFEFASLVFVYKILYENYLLAYFDPLTKFGNFKAMQRFLVGLKNCSFGIMRIENLDKLDPKTTKIVLKKISKILKHQDFKYQIFMKDKDFVFIFQQSDSKLCKAFLSHLEEGFNNTKFELSQGLKLEFKFGFTTLKSSFEESFLELEKSLAPKGA